MTLYFPPWSLWPCAFSPLFMLYPLQGVSSPPSWLGKLVCLFLKPTQVSPALCLFLWCSSPSPPLDHCRLTLQMLVHPCLFTHVSHSWTVSNLRARLWTGNSLFETQRLTEEVGRQVQSSCLLLSSVPLPLPLVLWLALCPQTPCKVKYSPAQLSALIQSYTQNQAFRCPLTWYYLPFQSEEETCWEGSRGLFSYEWWSQTWESGSVRLFPSYATLLPRDHHSPDFRHYRLVLPDVELQISGLIDTVCILLCYASFTQQYVDEIYPHWE